MTRLMFYTLVEMNSSITLMVTILSRRYYDNKSIIFKNEHVLALEVTVSEWYKYVHEWNSLAYVEWNWNLLQPQVFLYFYDPGSFKKI